MTRGMAQDGIPGLAHAEYYRRRAAGGVGLILTEGTVIDRPASRNMPGIPLFHGEAALVVASRKTESGRSRQSGKRSFCLA